MGTTKAKTLAAIRDQLTLFQIPPFLFFDKQEWVQSREDLVADIKEFFKGSALAVRSSAADEDGGEASKAGEYESVLKVPSKKPEVVIEAVEKVFSSYLRNGDRHTDDEVIVQSMVEETSMSGVVFTHDLNTGAPYYVINYDDVSGKTDTVTSGGGKHSNRTLYIHRGAVEAIRSDRFRKLILAVRELEDVMKSQFLDIEFAMGQDLTPYLLQVRAITTRPNWNRAVARRIDAALEGIQSFVRERFKPTAGVYGESTVLGQMPDWNPAEMIGRAPRNLAFSLYKTLITDNAWRAARERMGYAVPAGQPLMVSLAGQPYIDTRLSFHSYLPASLFGEIGKKLVDVWVRRLRENPELHDKVEFDVAITAWSFDVEEKIGSLTDGVLDKAEETAFKSSLKQLTGDLLHGTTDGSIESALQDISKLEEWQSARKGAEESDSPEGLFPMIENCIRFGTVPFSILARHGFIARTLLLSLEQRGILDREEIHQIQSGIRTVAGDLVEDMARLQNGEITRNEFMETYGHLRPGTYDILSLRYDQIENFGSGNSLWKPDQDHVPFELTARKREEIDKLLEKEGFQNFDSGQLLDYIRKATAGREQGKFVFTRTVSDMLEAIARFGRVNGLSYEEVSHLTVDDILSVITASGEGSVEDRLRRKAEEGAETHAVSTAIRLPQILYDEEGVHVVPFQVSHPNFITDKRIDAECVALKPGEPAPSISGKIVLIESADPGFDWIFAHQIAGLVTKYGGANSHMAIRCAEFMIPAAIGCGEQKYESLVKAGKVSLDCTAGLILGSL